MDLKFEGGTMFNSSVLDVAMGLIFVYLILGLMCTTVNEWIAQMFQMRSQVLKTGIQALLNSGLAAEFYGHSLVKSLSKPGGDPSYVSARTFSTALIDVLGSKIAPQNPPADPLANIKTSIEALPDSDVKRSLLLLLRNADGKLEAFQKNLETWFNDAMDRVSGWYKKRSQIITVVVAAVITIFANADTIEIARKLFVNPTLRETIVKEAGANAGQPPSGLTPQEKADLAELTGWSAEFETFHWMQALAEHKTGQDIENARADDSFPGMNLRSAEFFPWLWTVVPTHLLGWLLTAVAASLGAPFWFDTLNKFMNIRAAGTSPSEKGQDRSKV
jgi:hypothetical protein